MSMSTNESITKELRALIEEHWPHSDPTYRDGEMKFAPGLDGIADRIDERFSRELTAKQDEVNALRAKLEVSIPLPLDADGVPWTVEDIDKELINRDGDEHKIEKIYYNLAHKKWYIKYSEKYVEIASYCRHVKPKRSLEEIARDIDSCSTTDIGDFLAELHQYLAYDAGDES